MPKLVPYTQAEIDAMGIAERGCRDGTSPQVSFDRSGSIGTRTVFCNWAKRFDAVRYFLGDVNSYQDGGIWRLSRLLPQRLPGLPNFLAVKTDGMVKGFKWVGTDGLPDPEEEGELAPYVWTADTANRFRLAELTIQYERVPFEVEEDDFTDWEYDRYVQYVPGESTADYLTRPGVTQYYTSPDAASPVTGVPVPFGTGVVDPIHRFRLKWFRVSWNVFDPGEILWNRLFGTDTSAPWLGAINATPFAGFPAGTVLLENVALTYDPSVLGTNKMNWDIDYGFAVKPIGGWNRSWFFPPVGDPRFATLPAQKFTVGRTTTYYATADIPDGHSNYNVRDFADPDHGLFSVG